VLGSNLSVVKQLHPSQISPRSWQVHIIYVVTHLQEGISTFDRHSQCTDCRHIPSVRRCHYIFACVSNSCESPVVPEVRSRCSVKKQVSMRWNVFDNSRADVDDKQRSGHRCRLIADCGRHCLSCRYPYQSSQTFSWRRPRAINFSEQWAQHCPTSDCL
jgi:hypothetical protein